MLLSVSGSSDSHSREVVRNPILTISPVAIPTAITTGQNPAVPKTDTASTAVLSVRVQLGTFPEGGYRPELLHV